MIIMTEGSLQKTEKPAAVHRTRIIKFMFKKPSSILMHSPTPYRRLLNREQTAKSPKDVE
jgi:hypothetical protein